MSYYYLKTSLDQFKKLGFSVLVVWESELKNSKDVSKKIIDFAKNKTITTSLRKS